jgi:hypothetical protein
MANKSQAFAGVTGADALPVTVARLRSRAELLIVAAGRPSRAETAVGVFATPLTIVDRRTRISCMHTAGTPAARIGSIAEDPVVARNIVRQVDANPGGIAAIIRTYVPIITAGLSGGIKACIGYFITGGSAVSHARAGIPLVGAAASVMTHVLSVAKTPIIATTRVGRMSTFTRYVAFVIGAYVSIIRTN